MTPDRGTDEEAGANRQTDTHTHRHTMEKYSAIKRMKSCQLWQHRDLEGIMLWEIRQIETVQYDFSYIWNLKKKKAQMNKQNRHRLTDKDNSQGAGREVGNECNGWVQTSAFKVNESRGWNVQHGEQSVFFSLPQEWKELLLILLAPPAPKHIQSHRRMFQFSSVAQSRLTLCEQYEECLVD